MLRQNLLSCGTTSIVIQLFVKKRLFVRESPENVSVQNVVPQLMPSAIMRLAMFEPVLHAEKSDKCTVLLDISTFDPCCGRTYRRQFYLVKIFSNRVPNVIIDVSFNDAHQVALFGLLQLLHVARDNKPSQKTIFSYLQLNGTRSCHAASRQRKTLFVIYLVPP